MPIAPHQTLISPMHEEGGSGTSVMAICQQLRGDAPCVDSYPETMRNGSVGSTHRADWSELKEGTAAE